MGQRSQIIILEKGQYSNDINCIGLYHNQWSYGVGFLSNLNDLVTVYNDTLKKIKKESDGEIPRNRQIELLKRHLVKYVNLKDFPEARGYSENDFDPSTIHKIEDVFEYCDNNNGYIILYFEEEKLSYDIISGREDTDTERRVSPEEYLKLFYKNDEDLKAYFTEENSIKEIKEMIKSLNGFDRFDSQEIKLGFRKGDN